MKTIYERQPCNPNAIQAVKNVLNYFSHISGNHIITGQHTQTTVQKELKHILELTGKEPALCGFELLSYSPNINESTWSDACRIEVEENRNTLETAWEWINNKRGLVTFTWHWFSPLGGSDKSFYTEHTDFDASQAIIKGTPEYHAMIEDMDYMAVLLKPFCEKNIPILWRPFHESEGKWFWWGAKGPGPAKELFRLMYDRFTNMHQLNNLIWVWNSWVPEGYVGDEVADIISCDLYPNAHEHTDQRAAYEKLIKITDSDKLVALGEIGTLPSIEKLSESRIPWLWYMTWSNDFCVTENVTKKEVLQAMYSHDYAITLDKLPKLY